jgi:pimeloyl-[acyl-carrier protein] methyl ester esterase
MKKERIVLCSGWGQKGEAMQDLSHRLAAFAAPEITSVYELVQNWQTDYSSLPDVFSPAGPSIYAERLYEAYLSHSPAHLLGWSMGAMAALETAYYFPDAVLSIILAAGTASFCLREDELGVYQAGVPALNVRNMSIGLGRAPRLTLVLFMKNVYWQAFSREKFEEKTNEAISLERHILEHGLEYLLSTDLRGILGDLGKRTLIIHGEEDKIITPDAARYLEQHLPKAQLYLLENGSHAVCEQFPAEVADIIRGFLEDEQH